jgi:lysozyme family protein
MGHKAWGLGLVILMCLGVVHMAGAADWSIVPTITQRSEFDSNLNMSPTNVLSDYILSLQPAADFNYTTETSQLTGHIGLLGQHYISHSVLDHIDQNYQINGRYQATPKVNLSLASSYISDTTLLQELITSGLVIGRTPRQAIFASPGVTYNITERLLATANYTFNRVLYQSSQYTDYTSHQAGLNFTYLLSNEKTTLISNNIVRESLYAGGNNFKSIGIYVGLSHRFTERWDANIMSGANISFFSFNTQVLNTSLFPFFIQVPTLNRQRISESNVTPYVSASTTYRWTKLSATAGFSIDQQPSAYGAVYQVDRLYASVGYNFTERLSGSLSGSFSLSNQTSQNLNSEYNYYNVSPSLTYRITERLSVSPGYSFANASSLSSTGSAAHNHLAWIQFSYSYPIHYQK